MTQEEAIEYFDTLSDDDKFKEVYAHFGVAVYYAQVLEQQTINVIFLNQLIARKPKDNLEVNKIVDEYDLGRRTLGQLINEVKALVKMTEREKEELKDLLRIRNYISHNYFRFHIELFYSDAGKKRMIKDFISFRDRANSMDKTLLDYGELYRLQLGVSDEIINEEFEKFQAGLNEQALDEVYKTI